MNGDVTHQMLPKDRFSMQCKINRRELLSTAAAFGASAFAIGSARAQIPPRDARLLGGKAQVNMSFLYRGNNYPFINAFKSCDRIWEATNTTEDGYALLDANSMPTRMPTGTGVT